jgi:hypothetical protein
MPIQANISLSNSSRHRPCRFVELPLCRSPPPVSSVDATSPAWEAGGFAAGPSCTLARERIVAVAERQWAACDEGRPARERSQLLQGERRGQTRCESCRWSGTLARNGASGRST